MINLLCVLASAAPSRGWGLAPDPGDWEHACAVVELAGPLEQTDPYTACGPVKKVWKGAIPVGTTCFFSDATATDPGPLRGGAGTVLFAFDCRTRVLRTTSPVRHRGDGRLETLQPLSALANDQREWSLAEVAAQLAAPTADWFAPVAGADRPACRPAGTLPPPADRPPPSMARCPCEYTPVPPLVAMDLATTVVDAMIVPRAGGAAELQVQRWWKGSPSAAEPVVGGVVQAGTVIVHDAFLGTPCAARWLEGGARTLAFLPPAGPDGVIEVSACTPGITDSPASMWAVDTSAYPGVLPVRWTRLGEPTAAPGFTWVTGELSMHAVVARTAVGEWCPRASGIPATPDRFRPLPSPSFRPDETHR